MSFSEDRSKVNPAIVVLFSVVLLMLPSCSSDKKSDSSSPNHMSTVSIRPGEAGGVFEDTYTASATVSDIDHVTRDIALTTEDGKRTTFKAPAEVRNFDQIKKGDKVTATVNERLVVVVRSGSEDPSMAHAAALARSPKGAMPGIMVGEAYEVVASVKAIDSTNRTATLQFTGGRLMTFPVRSDVDLGRYKVGDTVVIQVTDTLSLLVERP